MNFLEVSIEYPKMYTKYGCHLKIFTKFKESMWSYDCEMFYATRKFTLGRVEFHISKIPFCFFTVLENMFDNAS